MNALCCRQLRTGVQFSPPPPTKLLSYRYIRPNEGGLVSHLVGLSTNGRRSCVGAVRTQCFSPGTSRPDQQSAIVCMALCMMYKGVMSTSECSGNENENWELWSSGNVRKLAVSGHFVRDLYAGFENRANHDRFDIRRINKLPGLRW